jgi:hypothetical protein
MNYSNLRNEIDRRVFKKKEESDSEYESDAESSSEYDSNSDSNSEFSSVSNHIPRVRNESSTESAESEDTVTKRFEKFSNMQSNIGVQYPTINFEKFKNTSNLVELKDNSTDLGKYAPIEPIEGNNFNEDKSITDKEPELKDLKINFNNSSDINEFIVGIDSTFKENLTSTTSEVVWQFDPPIKNIIRMEIETIEFPNTFYSFSSTKANTSFRIDSSTVTIDNGNYDISGIISSINTGITSVGITDMSFGYNTYSNRVFINTSGTHTVYFAEGTFKDRIDDWGLGYYLGFRSKTLSGISTKTTATSSPNMYVDSYVFLKIDEFNNYQQSTWHNNEKAFCKIQLSVAKGQVQYYNTAQLFSKFYVFNLPAHLNKWTIQVIDKYGQLVELWDSKFSFSMKLTQINNSKIHDSYRKTLLKE